MYYYILGAVVIGVLLWTAGSYAVIWSIEEPTYTVQSVQDGYEIRTYAPYIKAETTVTGNYDEATEQGFRIIADYIFGNNTTKESISMTAPVLERPQENVSQKIAMTVPVLEKKDTTTRTIAFVVPAAYTLNTLPTPTNPAVKLVSVPARTVAVLRYSWYPTETRTNAKKELLTSYLIRDKVTITGATETARYNPPLSMPLTLRNEIYVPIE